ncbi:MAG: hypothetical protein JW715_01555 [Sedimentisphaerales bacterium]|nr:hypothetical protein [Sedimentisphaerales bacterium]
MIKKIGRFFEENVEKITLIVVGLLCVFLFIWRILLSPNTVEIENEDGRMVKLSPSVVDERILEIALKLNRNKSGLTKDVNSYESKKDEYLSVMDSAIKNIDINQIIPNPEIFTPETVAQAQYNVPKSIGNITEVAVEHIRAAAYVPTEPVTEQRTYDQVGHEPNDIDFVTVQGKFDIAACNRVFHERFVDQVEEQWADANLAKPIFASVQLQRRELGGDGMWGDWQNVERTKIDQYKDLFENIRYGENLPPGGLMIQKVQFDNPMIQMSLLQPQAYEMASAREEWLPPVLHKSYADEMRNVIRQDREEARKKEAQERERDTADRNRRGGGRGAGGGINDRTGNIGRGTGRSGGGARSGNRDTTYGITDTGRGSRRSGTGRGRGAGRGTELEMMEMGRFMPGGTLTGELSEIDKIYQEFNKISLNYNTDLSKMEEPIVFWAHDDTVEPEKVYQYRIRLGVFNPVAEGENDDVIIWSQFSRETEPVEIQGRLYFFVKGIQEATSKVTITVCKYFLGYWRSEDFREVGPGEAIGGIKKYETEEPEEEPIFAAGNRGMITPVVTESDEPTSKPEEINYDTGAVIIDIVAMNDWVVSDSRSMTVKPYYDMLYSFDGDEIEHTPVSAANWSLEKRRIYTQIQTLTREEPEPFKAFGSSRTQRGMGINQFRGMEDFGVPMRMMME